jgi:Tfp pilus assembly protein PilF
MMRVVLAALILAAVAPKTGKAQKVLHPTTAEDYLALSAAELQLGKYDAAEKTARDGLAKHPESQGFHLALGTIEEARPNPANAFYEYQWEVMRAGAAAPTGKSAAERMGNLLRTARGASADEMRKVAEAVVATRQDPPAALKLLSEVYEARGEIFVVRLLLAEANVEAGHGAKAQSILRTLISEDPRFVPAYVDLANALRADGKPKDADAMLAKARDIDPAHWALAPPDSEPSAAPSP